MTSYERRVKKLHDHVMKNAKKAEEKRSEPTVKELQALLTEKGIDFDPKAKKVDLLEILNKSEESQGGSPGDDDSDKDPE